MTTTNRAQADLRAQLETRLAELRAKLAVDLVPSGEATLDGIAGEVRDSADEAVAIERTDLRTALMQRDARELDELHAALLRLDGGEYGICVECGLDIEAARLGAVLTARRCSPCQEAFEHRAALAPGR